jgi:hypothetical protein
MHVLIDQLKSTIPYITNPDVVEAVAAWRTVNFCCELEI